MFSDDLQKGLRPRRAVRQAMAHGDKPSSNIFLDLQTAPVVLWLSDVCLFCADVMLYAIVQKEGRGQPLVSNAPQALCTAHRVARARSRL